MTQRRLVLSGFIGALWFSLAVGSGAACSSGSVETLDSGTMPSGDGGGDGGACEARHHAACSQEQAKACGHKPDCTDLAQNAETECVCTNGKWNCGKCPPAPRD